MMISLLIAAAGCVLQPATPTPTPAGVSPPAAPRVTPSDPPAGEPKADRSDEIFQGGAIETVAEGLKFTEGPLWRPDGTLVFVDLSGDAVYQVDLKDGLKSRKPGEGVKVLREKAGGPAGTAVDAQGRLLHAQFNGSVVRVNADGSVEVIADQLSGKKLNQPNDLVVRSDGSIFFTDFGKGATDDRIKSSGLYRIDPAGALHQLTTDIVSPNGLAFSPDERVLYVALYAAAQLRAYDVAQDGTLSNPRVFAEVRDPAIKGRSTPDGVKVDASGNVWTTGAGGIWVFSPKGERIARLEVPGGASNLCFGGADGKTLFITSRNKVLSTSLKVRALPAGK